MDDDFFSEEEEDTRETKNNEREEEEGRRGRTHHVLGTRASDHGPRLRVLENAMWWPTRVSGLLESNPKSGLTRVQRSSSEGKRHEREVKFGKNEFEYPPPKTFLQLCVIALEDFTVRILIAAAVVSLAIGAGMKEHRDEYGYLEGIAILIVVMVVVFLQAYIDYAKEKKFRQLNSVKDNYNVKTVIDGEVEQIPAGEVLVGDVLELTAGDKIPADCVYLEGSKLKTNEAAMTGEPIDIGKNLEKDPFLLSGTSVSEGSGGASSSRSEGTRSGGPF